MLNIVAISGSLRKASCNTGILRALVALNHKELNIQIVSIADFPIFNQDIEQQGIPEAVKKVAEKVVAADGLIFAIPENNFSISAALKNAYDWLSRGGAKAPVHQKAVAFVSTGGQGGKNAQGHMRDIIKHGKLRLLEEPKVQIARYGPGNFGEDGSLISQTIIDELVPFLDAYAAFVKQPKN